MVACYNCDISTTEKPSPDCHISDHWRLYAFALEEKLELTDEQRDSRELSDWFVKHPKVRDYTCNTCNREYKLPIHLVYADCVCGSHVKIRYMGYSPDDDILDAARAFFGNERIAQLGWIAEVVGGDHNNHMTASEIRKSIRQVLDRWYFDPKIGWRKK